MSAVLCPECAKEINVEFEARRRGLALATVACPLCEHEFDQDERDEMEQIESLTTDMSRVFGSFH